VERLSGMRIATAAIGAGAAGAASMLLGTTEAAASLSAVLGGVATFLALDTGAQRLVSQPEPSPVSDGGSLAVGDIVDSLEEPVLLVARQMVAHANPAALRVLGDHIVGEDVRLAIRHPAVAEKLLEPRPSLDTQPWTIGLVGLGNRERRWELSIHQLAAEHRLIHLSDRTQTYAAERMRVDFVANASHELRTPLATLIGFIETLEEAGDDAATRNRFLKIMAGEARRMQRLVSDLMSLSRIEADKHSVPQESVALAALAGEARDALSHGIDAEKSRIDITLKPDTPAVIGDRAQLSQLLHNLIGNALKYGRSNGTVRVRIGSVSGNMVRLVVEDEGDGIPPEHLPRLTERFYRVDASRSRAAGGTGLGLAIVKHIVERHRGRLDIRSVVGTGTTVSVLLPAALSSRSHSSVTDSASNGPRGVTNSA
jgi:two-component system phosphate regulon sensor histidine kinase PhoR